MEKGLFNITSATTTSLIIKGERAGNIKSINIANCHATDLVYVSLYLDDNTNQTYFFKKNLLYPGERIFLNNGISFDNISLGLKITTEAVVTSQAIDTNVIIK